MTVVASSKSFAPLYVAWVQLWFAVQAVIGPLAMDILFGFWFSGSIFAAYIIRKPFASFFAAILAGFVQILAGNSSGAIPLLIAMFVIRVVRGMLPGGLLGKVPADAIHKTGVTNRLAIDAAKRAHG